MTYPVFTRDELPNGHPDNAASPELWPEHEHASGSTLKAQPVQGIFGVEDAAGNVSKCDEGFGFVYLDANDELGFLTLSEFEAQYKGAEHVRGALGL